MEPFLDLRGQGEGGGRAGAAETLQVVRARLQRMGEIQEALEKEEGYAYDLYFLDDKPPDPEQLEQGKSKVVTLPMDFNFEVSLPDMS